VEVSTTARWFQCFFANLPAILYALRSSAPASAQAMETEPIHQRADLEQRNRESLSRDNPADWPSFELICSLSFTSSFV